MVYNSATRFAEISAHARWITGISVLPNTQLIASVSEDTLLNLWKVQDDSSIALVHSCQVAQKLLTGVAFCGGSVGVVAYDSDQFHRYGLEGAL